MELERAVLVNDRVAGVVSALESDDDIRLLRQEVSDLAFALVAPLSTDDGRHGHVFECYPGCCPATRAPSFASSTKVRLRDGSRAHQSVASQSGSSAGRLRKDSETRSNSRPKRMAAGRWWYGLVTRSADRRPARLLRPQTVGPR